jgi:hypothetical protein
MSNFEGKQCRQLKSKAKPLVLEHLVEVCDAPEPGSTCKAIAHTDGNLYIGPTTIHTSKKAILRVRYKNVWDPLEQEELTLPPYIPTDNAQYSTQFPGSYVTNQKMGITEARIQIAQFPQLTPTILWPEGFAEPTQQNPHQAPAAPEAVATFNLASLSPKDGTRLTSSLTVKNGGFIELLGVQVPLTNQQSPAKDDRREVVFDFSPPYASGNMLKRHNPELSTDNVIKMSAQGWKDDASGIEMMEYEVCPMHQVGNKLDWNPRDCIIRKVTAPECLNPQHVVEIPLPGDGMYTLLVVVYDRAQNIKKARRLVIHHRNPEVTVGPVKKLLVTSAGRDTSPGVPITSGDELWQTTNGVVEATWDSVFADHDSAKWLFEVLDHLDVEPSYDEPTTSVISRKATKNTNGIVKIEWALRCNSGGGGTSEFEELLDFRGRPAIDLATPRTMTPGHKYELIVRASNIWGRTGEASQAFYVDSTPPVVTVLGLSSGNTTGLEFHGENDLTSMLFKFKAFDEESSLKKLEWFITEDLGQSNEACTVCQPEKNTVAIDICAEQNPDCVCTPAGLCRMESHSLPLSSHQELKLGEHGRSYVFVVKATNRAGLITESDPYTVKVDTSPPTAGYVRDGLAGTFDVDFQQERTLEGWWSGFNDPDSGINHYRYKFSDTKLSEMEGDWSPQLTREQTHPDQMTAPEEGKWFLCVVAFNNAGAKSPVVCSDGVTTDQKPPTIKSIALHGSGRTSAGIAKDSAGQLWIMDTDSTRRQVIGTDAGCESMPIRQLSAYTPVGSVAASDVCSSAVALEPKFYQSSTSIVSVSWVSESPMEEMKEFQVGLSSTSGGQADVRGWQSVGLLNTTLIKHGRLGALFFVQVKAIKQTGAFAVAELGPVFVDPTAPSSGKVTGVAHLSGLQIQWSGFADTELQSTLTYEVGVGSSKDGHDNIVAFRRPSDSLALCDGAKLCATVPASNFGGASTVFVKVRACNGAALCTVTPSSAASPVGSYPAHGKVYEVDAESGVAADVNFQTSTTKITAIANGFTGGALTFTVAVGTAQGKIDVSPFTAAEITQGTPFTVQGLSLDAGTTYFVSVRASNGYGATTASSNGVTPVDAGAIAEGSFVVHDGEGCSRKPSLLANTTSGSELLQTGSVLTLHTQLLHVGHAYTLTFAVAGEAAEFVLEAMGASWSVSVDEGTATAEFVALAVNAPLELSVTAASVAITLSQMILQECTAEQKAQSHSDFISAWWSLPATVAASAHVKFFQHAVEVEGGSGEWTKLRDFETASSVTSNTLHLDLVPGGTYRSIVRACHPAGCYSAVATDGVTVVAQEPISGKLTATYTQPILHDGTTDLLISWQEFTDFGTQVRPVYQWAIAADNSGSDLISDWTTVTPATGSTIEGIVVHHDATASGNAWSYQVEAKVNIDFSHYDAHHHLYAAVRSISYSGTTGLGLARFDATSLLRPELRVAVLDLHEPVTDQAKPVDVQYTLHTDRLASAWPSLWPEWKPDWYEWSISSQRSFVNCGNASSAYCGRTTSKSVVTEGLGLSHGDRYYFCVRAGQTTLLDDGFETIIPAPSNVSCSNGVTVDLTPPVAGVVELGYPSSHAASRTDVEGSIVYQRGVTELLLRWHGFVDVEEYENVPHVSGVARYTVKIGSAPGAADVFSPQDVGGATHLVARNLSLVSGHTYYATVIAFDYAGASTEVVSRGVRIDQTPPPNSAVFVTQHIDEAEKPKLVVEWTEAIDAESVVVDYLVGVGTAAGSGDITAFVSNGIALTAVIELPSTLLDGQAFIVTVKATNAVGAVQSSSTHELLLSLQAPGASVVNDVDPEQVLSCRHDKPCQEIQFLAHQNALAISWTAFATHSSIETLSWAIGTTPGAGDVRGFEMLPATAASHAIASSLNLQDGTRYFATVRACDMQARCIVSTSNGVTPDSTAPVAGLVLDGLGDDDAEYQVATDVVGATWEGFHDPHSKIARYEWCVSSTNTPGRCDVLAFQSVGVATRGVATVLNDGKKIGPGGHGKIFVTVRATNNAGLSTVVVSNGVQIDYAPPGVKADAKLVSTHTSPHASEDDNHGYQSSKAVLEATWSFVQQRKGPLAIWYTVGSHTNAVAPVPIPRKTYSQTGVLIPGLNLEDGSRYYVHATACDPANLCTTSQDPFGIVVDSTPPTSSGWGDNWVWLPRKLSFSWGACDDPHSGVQSYLISVGSRFGSADIVPAKKIPASQLRADFQTIAKVSMNTNYYATMTCFNKAGLASEPLHVQLKPLSGKVLKHITHSCTVVGCKTQGSEQRQCSCGAGPVCPSATLPTCGTSKLPTSLPLLDGFAGQDINMQHDDTELHAHWIYTDNWQPVFDQIRLQFAVFMGAKRAPQMAGRDWLDIPSEQTYLTFALDGQTLTAGQTYSIHLRVWDSHSSFVDFKTDGVKIAPRGPQISRRERLIETAADGDADHSADQSKLTVSWAGTKGAVFFQDTGKPSRGAEFVTHEVAVGTLPGAIDVVPYQVLDDGQVARKAATFGGLSLVQGRKYWMAVRVTDAAGLSAIAITDGLRVDTTAPLASSAVVLDGDQPADIDSQDGSQALWSTWYGFSDPESGIRGYRVSYSVSDVAVKCAAEDAIPPCVVAASTKLPGTDSWVDVGMRLAHEVVPTPVPEGRYHVYVKAYNMLNEESAVVVSDSVVVDNSPPVAAACNTAKGTNLVASGSFDVEGSWTLGGGASVARAGEGASSLLLSGLQSSASQKLAVKSGSAYTLSFVAQLQADTNVFGAASGVVSAGADSFYFKVIRDQTAAHEGWQRFDFHFTADSSTVELSFVAGGSAAYAPKILIDDVSSVLCGAGGSSSPVQIGSGHISSIDTVSARWSVGDTQSGIVDSLWAIGTVPGGEQLQTYTSVGRQTHGLNSGLVLQHNVAVYVSVVARNGAGLSKKFVSKRVTVDHTPPVIGELVVVKAQKQKVSVSWSAATDVESGLEGCAIAVGRSPLSVDVIDYVQPSAEEQTARLATVDITGTGARDRDLLFANIKCTNKAGLTAKSTRSFKLLNKPPQSTDAVVVISALSQSSIYAVAPGYQSSTATISAAWTGFGTPGDALEYELELRGPGAIAGWKSVGAEQHALLSDLQLQEGAAYTVAVRALDFSKQQSSESLGTVMVDNSPPTDGGGRPCAKSLSKTKVQLSWAGLFEESTCQKGAACLRYEVSVGSSYEASNVMTRSKMESEIVEFDAVLIADKYFVTVTAINGAGISVSARHEVQVTAQSSPCASA